MAQWAVVIPTDRYELERLYHHEGVPVDSGQAGVAGPADGDEAVVVVAGAQPRLVGHGRLRAGADGALTLAYLRRAFDAPRAAPGVPGEPGVRPVEPGLFRDLVDRLDPPGDRQSWLVSLDLPIEAESPAEAVRQFWSYVQQLGPRELPTFVSPYGDELAMQAFVLGEEANLDPEEDE
jgi:hypothetical protein